MAKARTQRVEVTLNYKKMTDALEEFLDALVAHVRLLVKSDSNSKCGNLTGYPDERIEFLPIDTTDADALAARLQPEIDVRPFRGKAQVFLVKRRKPAGKRPSSWLEEYERIQIRPSMYSPGTVGVQGAMDRLSAKKPDLRLIAIRDLEKAGADAAPALAKLAKLVKDKDEAIAIAAVDAIGAIGPSAAKETPGLLKRLGGERTPLQSAILESLSKIGPAAFPAFCKRVVEEPNLVKGREWTFTRFGKECLGEFIELSHHEKPAIRRMALDAVADWAPRRVLIEHLTAALSDPVKLVRKTAYQCLRAKANQSPKSAARMLRPLMKQATHPDTIAYCRRLLEEFSPSDFKDEHAALLKRLRPSDAASVPISSDSLQHLQLEGWNGLSASAKKKLQAEITQALLDAGYDFRDAKIQKYGPRSDSQAIAQWRDRRGRRFVLIPGGSFRPGFSGPQLKQLEKIAKGVETYEYRPINPKRAPIFNAGFCDLRQTTKVDVPPMLMAGDLIRQGKTRVKDVDLYEIAELLEEHRWSVPSSHEFEWAILGGRKSIFHWGDEPRSYLASKRLDAPPDSTKWPECTRFGLTDPLAEVTWCQPKTGGQPIVSRGGARTYSPWQDCLEWLLYLTAASGRHPVIEEFGMRFRGAVRPVIRFQPS